MADKTTASHLFLDVSRSLCPACRRLVDAQVVARNGQVILRKRCPEHGWTEALLSSDLSWYLHAQKYNRPGLIPPKRAMPVLDGCPYDCGLCTEHQQHTCLAILEINSACNLRCPVCFMSAGDVFMINVTGFMDAHTFEVRRVMKCCIHELLPDGRLVPFCAYNTVGYREQVLRSLAHGAPHRGG